MSVLKLPVVIVATMLSVVSVGPTKNLTLEAVVPMARLPESTYK